MSVAGNTFRSGRAEGPPGLIGTLVVGVVALLMLPAALILTGIVSSIVPSFGLELGLLVMPVAFLVLFLVLLNERIWIFGAFAAHLFMLLGDSMHKTGMTEVLFGIIVLFGTTVWIAKELFWFRRPLVRTSFDALFLMFFGLITAVTLLMTLVHGGSMAFYFKEWGILFDFLFYLPLKRVLRSDRDVAVLVTLFILMASVCAVYNFIHFREGIAQAVFEWQIGGSRVNLNETTSMAFLSLGTALYIFTTRKLLKLVGLGVIVVALLALLVSFSRGPIVAGFCGALVVLVLSPFALSKKAILPLALAIPIGGMLTYVAFPKIASYITESVVQRLVTVRSAASDVSFNARLVESASILRFVKQSPVLGYGFGVHYTFLDPLSHATVITYYAHNGYTWMLFKFGLPLALVLLLVIYYPAFRAYTNPPSADDRLRYGVMVGCIGAMVSMAITHFTSNQFTQMSSVMIYPLTWALLEYVNRYGILDNPSWSAGERERLGPALSTAVE